MRNLIMVATAAFALAGCDSKSAGNDVPASGQSAERLTQTEAEKIVANAEATWAGAQIEPVMANYANDAVVFDTSTLPPTTDRNAQTRGNAAFLTMKPADFRVDPRHVQLLDNDTIVSSGVLSFTANAGATRQLMRTRFSQVYQRQADGSWKVVHEHMSAPPPGTQLP